MSEWKEIAVGDLCTITRGGSPRPIQDFIQDSGTPWVKIADAKADGRYIYKTKEYIKTEGETKSRVVFPGDFILSNSATPGLPRFMKIRACIHDGWLLLRDFVDDIDQMFLHYLLVKERESLLIQGNGSIFTNLKTDILREHKVLLPPLLEQRAIAEVLSSLDDKIDLLHRQNKTLEAMAETLFRQWFLPVGGQGVERKGLNHDSDDLRDDLDSKNHGNHANPKNQGSDNVEKADEEWEEGVLGDLVEVKYGKDHKKLLDGVIPVYGSGGLMRYAEKPLYEGESVLIPRKGSLNNVIYVNEAFWTVDTMFFTIMKRDHLAKFVYQFIKQKDLASMNVGSAVPSMTTAVLNNMPIEIPPNGLLVKFDRVVSEFYRKIKSNQTQIRTLEKMRDTLLPKLMSGEIRLNYDSDDFNDPLDCHNHKNQINHTNQSSDK